jgi:hypothetical protein
LSRQGFYQGFSRLFSLDDKTFVTQNSCKLYTFCPARGFNAFFLPAGLFIETFARSIKRLSIDDLGDDSVNKLLNDLDNHI